MKKLLALLAVMVIAGGAVMAKPVKQLDVLPLFTSQSSQANRVWVGTFQLVWNDLMDDIVKGPVKFTNGKSKLAEALNEQDFKADMLSDDSYYKTHGIANNELKQTIETALKEKFNETSGILDGIDWNSKNYLLYAMLKKDFQFVNAFDKLKPAKFANSRTKVEYFGIDKKSSEVLDRGVNVLFYNSSDDFAVSLATKGNDVVYLYRTDDNKTFDKLYADMLKKQSEYTGDENFSEKDTLSVPNIGLYREKTFNELSGKKIKGTDFVISQALETIDFKMNNEGVKLKSEAAIIMKMSMVMPVTKPRDFNFNDTFVLFLQENEKAKPYFALRVNDVSLINKTAKK